MPQSSSTTKRAKGATRTRATALYRHSLKSLRTGPLFSAFPYPTKISPEAIALFIASHTKPGDTVFDGFAGSGTTGVAALLCGSPTPEMLAEVKRLKLTIRWGARRAILYDVGVMGTTIAQTLCNPPDPQAFRLEADRILREAENALRWMYEARDPEGQMGAIRYVIWSEVLECPNCGKHVTLWEGCVRRNPAKVNRQLKCPYCARQTATNDARRVTRSTEDELLGERVLARARRPVWLYGVTGKKEWSRPVDASDRLLWKRITETALPASVPCVEIP